VVSTSEELSFPWLAHPKRLEQLTQPQRRPQDVLATGVNPGFLMDSLPLFLTSISERVDRIQISRIKTPRFDGGPSRRRSAPV